MSTVERKAGTLDVTSMHIDQIKDLKGRLLIESALHSDHWESRYRTQALGYPRRPDNFFVCDGQGMPPT
jgi:hypothetical protein